MDPNATLTEIREIITANTTVDLHLLDGGYTVNRLVELIEALDSWIMKGGVLPKDWAQAYVRAVAEKEV